MKYTTQNIKMLARKLQQRAKNEPPLKFKSRPIQRDPTDRKYTNNRMTTNHQTRTLDILEEALNNANIELGDNWNYDFNLNLLTTNDHLEFPEDEETLVAWESPEYIESLKLNQIIHKVNNNTVKDIQKHKEQHQIKELKEVPSLKKKPKRRESTNINKKNSKKTIQAQYEANKSMVNSDVFKRTTTMFQIDETERKRLEVLINKEQNKTTRR